MKALILAGGFGTGLKDIVGDIPKPMVLIAGKPFLEHQINFLKDNGINEIIFAVHHSLLPYSQSCLKSSLCTRQ